MKKTILFFWLLSIAFIKRHLKYIALGIIFGFIAALFILQTHPIYNRLSSLRNKRIGMVGRFRENSLPLTIQNQLSLGLTSIMPSGEATSSIAFKWTVDPSEKIYIFYLRTDVYWHVGKKFTAKDINYKIKDATIIPIDNTTLKITLKEPFSPLPTTLSGPIIKPDLIGVGKYKLSAIHYAGDLISDISLKSLIPDFPAITYKFYPTLSEAVLAFKLGEIDSLQNIAEILDLETWPKVKVTQTSVYDNYVGLFFNLKDSLFKEKEIRQALIYAIPDIPNFVKAFTPISPLSWAYSQKVRLYRFDPETSSKMLAKSPLASSSSELTITTFSSFVKLAQSIVDAWQKVGVQAKIRIVNSLPTDYQMLLLAQNIPADPDQYPYWQSTQNIANFSHYDNKKIDKLLEDGRKSLDQEKRKKIYADFQRYLVDDAPVIFLYYPKVYTVERK